MFSIGYMIGSYLDINREEPWVIVENDNTIKIIRSYNNIVEKPSVEVQ